MMSFWHSVDKIAKEGLKLTCLGIAVTVLARLFPDYNWIWWVGLVTTVVGVVLRYRGDHLKTLDSAPRKLTSADRERFLVKLSTVQKAPVKVNYLNDGSEPKQYAAQLKEALETAGFKVVGFSGAISFEPRTGICITVCEWDGQNATALGIHDAFLSLGIPTVFQAVMKQKEPSIEICVDQKSPRTL